MQVKLDAFEQEIEDNAEAFVPITGAKRQEIEAILASAAQSAQLHPMAVPLVTNPDIHRLRA